MRACTKMLGCALAVALVPLASCGQRDPTTPEQKAARGDELLRKLSDTLKGAQAFSFSVVESHERMRRNGQKSPVTLKRDVQVRRPDRLWSHATGSDGRDVTVTYDSKAVTVVGAGQKIYATIKAPATLDETLDLISERFDLRVAVGDFLYSSPYDSFASKESKGGWVRRTTVDGKECDEVAYSMPQVDFTLSMTRAAPTVPCQVEIVYKQEPGKPVTRLVFSNWNLQARPADSQFVANVPAGYEQIPIVERIPKSELKADAAKAMAAAVPK